MDIEFNVLFSTYYNSGDSCDKPSLVFIIMKALILLSSSFHHTSPQWHPDDGPSVGSWGITIAPLLTG